MRLHPTYKFKTITNIPEEFFKSYDVALFDLDNTLVVSETLDSPLAIREWFAHISKDIPCTIVSNSRSTQARSQALRPMFGCPVVGPLYKPFGFGARKLLKDLKNKKAIIVGDRLFTDVWFGNSHGMDTLLVGPVSTKEPLGAKIMRAIERIIL